MFSKSDDFTVIAILLATVKDKDFAMYVQGIQDSGNVYCHETRMVYWQKMRIYAKKVNRMLAVPKDYRIFANENCVFTQKK